ncbi:unnamed protein product [Kuraishia capsulata CBS 1993]|uniref:HIT domain-containing protein n=1 Tax=Kuraishia capsulata CBS 1993 TaxID=1382522 RepID=W6MVM2_9ASCO|nr:uncharacterized protein KUCA_T00002352001 [Kuraishia capsulata CBS 1993]CDK26380.1 unnamed protein product [Kuraishia capsulata CBS 1993]
MSLIREFQYSKILTSNAQEKTVTFLGKIKGEDAILKLEKTPFATETSEIDAFFAKNTISDIKELASNDVYHWGVSLLEQTLQNPTCKYSLVYPATETHIAKFETAAYHMISETPEHYQNVVKPYISTMQGDRLKWVRNILFEGAEAERVVYRNDDREKGFVLVPDMKWDGTTLDTLYICAIVLREDIASIRDLKREHVNWLNGMQDEIKAGVAKYYGNKIKGDELRIFVHYQPSYYHFHIHIVNISHPGLASTMSVGRAVLLQDVIDQLEYLEDGIASRTLTYALAENHKLWDLGLKYATRG